MKIVHIMLAVTMILLLVGCNQETGGEKNVVDNTTDNNCTESQQIVVEYSRFNEVLTETEFQTYLDNATGKCSLATLFDAVNATHPNRNYQDILVKKYIKYIDTEAITELSSLAVLTMQINPDWSTINNSIKNDKIIELVEVSANYGINDYQYRYFSFANQWEQDNKEIEPGRNLFVGSSIIERFNLDRYYPEAKFLNRGISSEWTIGLSERLETSIYDINPSKVFVYVGGNDFWQSRTPEQIRDKTSEIIDGIKMNVPGAKIYLLAIFPVSETSYTYTDGNFGVAEIDAANVYYKELAQNKGITYIDCVDVLKNDRGFLYDEYTSDGVHLTAFGYNAVAEVIRPYIEE